MNSRPFFFNDTATTEIYTLSLHDALPISRHPRGKQHIQRDRLTGRQDGIGTDPAGAEARAGDGHTGNGHIRSEEHTPQLQQLAYLVYLLLLETKDGGTCSQQERGSHSGAA